MLLHRNSSSHASSPAVMSVKSQAAVSQAFSPPTAGEGAAGRTDTLAGRLTGVPSTSGAASTDADTARPKAAPLSDSIEHLLQQLQAQQAAAATQPNAQLRVPPPPHPIGHGTPAAGASPAMHAAGVFEMVEVKNTSPFGTASGGSVLDKKGKARPHFTLWDKGPRTQVTNYLCSSIKAHFCTTCCPGVSRSWTDAAALMLTIRCVVLLCIEKHAVLYVMKNCMWHAM